MNRKAGAALGLALAVCPAACLADTLFDAIQMAYETNPTLRAQRAQLRVDDEGYVQARAGYGPQVSVTGQYGWQGARVPQTASPFAPATTTDYSAGTGSAQLIVTQPLYTGGAIKAQVQGAAATVLQSREALRQAEGDLLTKVITAYVDVRRDRETLRILREEVDALAADDKEAQARGALGVATRTDVAQAEARLLAARSQLIAAQGRLNASSAEYLAVVGESPGELEPEPDLPGMPLSADDAFATADQNNPQILAAIQAERAAHEKINEAKAAMRPTVSIRIDAGISPIEPYLPKPYDQSVTAAAVVTQPLFTSGIYSSKIRQAVEGDNEALLNIEATRRAVVELVAQSWDQAASTRAANEVVERQVEAEEEALKGDKIEERAGLRTTLDLLNAENELNEARLTLIQGRHDAYVAGASLLAAMGVLEARYLTPKGQIYDPVAALDRVKNRGVPPWVDLIGKVDGVGAPSTSAPALSAPNAGTERPPASALSPSPTP